MVGFARAGLVIGAVLMTAITASAQPSDESTSERGMPDKAPADGAVGKSERGMPDRTKDSGTPPAASERAMPAPDKK